MSGIKGKARGSLTWPGSIGRCNIMIFRKQKTLGHIVEHLAYLGMNRDGRSLFLDSEEISRDLVLDFIKTCNMTEEAFRFSEDVLRFTSAYNAIAVLLSLKDKALEGRILAILRDPAFFLEHYNPSGGAFGKEFHDLLERGYRLFLDNVVLSERLIAIGANEILASRFMNLLSNSRIGKEDDTKIWLVFSLGIYNHFQTLRQAVARAKKKLALR